MAQMMIEPSEIHEEVPGGLWIRNYGERMPLRGDNWHHGAWAGRGALFLCYPRSTSANNMGFRPAFIGDMKI
jgi:hypothetical protein